MANPNYSHDPEKNEGREDPNFSQFSSEENLESFIRNGNKLKKEGKNKEAFECLKQAADRGDAQSQFDTGSFYAKGKGVQKDFKKASYYYQLAAKLGNLNAKKILFKNYNEGREGLEQSFEKALKYLKPLTKRGNIASLMHLGFYYALGLGGLDQNEEKALRYFKIAINHGAFFSFYPIELYFKKNGISQQKPNVQALKYFKRVADKGNKTAQYILGRIYEYGDLGVQSSWEEAIKYYTLAAIREQVDAVKLLGNCYHLGKHVTPSEEEAANYFQLGASLGDPDCLDKLGQYYFEARGGLSSNFLKGLHCVKSAAAKGNIYSQKVLKFLERILHPHARPVDLTNYLKDLQLSTFVSILESYEKKPMFLSDFSFDWAQAQIIREAMLANSHFTVICSESEFERLRYAFELRGYDRETDLKWEVIGRYSNYEKLYACVFIQAKDEV